MPLTADQQSVAEANSSFYDALTKRDLVAMERLWFPADWVECVHPGMAPHSRLGRGARELGDVVRRGGQPAHGGGDGRADSTHRRCRLGRVRRAHRQHERGRMVSSMAHATNIFVRHDNAWRMARPSRVAGSLPWTAAARGRAAGELRRGATGASGATRATVRARGACGAVQPCSRRRLCSPASVAQPCRPDTTTR